MSARAQAWAWAQIAAGRGGSPVSKLVLLRLADRADPEGRCWPGHDRTASDLNVSVKAVKETIRALEKEGLVIIERRQDDQGRDLPNLYFLPIDQPESDGAGRGQILPPGGQKTAQGRGQNLPPNLKDKEEPKTERVHAQPPAAARAAARGAQQQPLSSFLGMVFYEDNARDAVSIGRIKTEFCQGDIPAAVAQARGLDPQGRAWPTAVLQILLAQQAAALKPPPASLQRPRRQPGRAEPSIAPRAGRAALCRPAR